MPIRAENRALYPTDWKAISLRVRRAAGGRCEWCNARNGEPHPITGSQVVLTVAHLDHDPRNCADSNLRALCARCHNRYDGPARRQGIKARRQAKLGQGTLELTAPAAAGPLLTP